MLRVPGILKAPTPIRYFKRVLKGGRKVPRAYARAMRAATKKRDVRLVRELVGLWKGYLAKRRAA